MQSVDNSRSSSEYYCRLYWVHALITHDLRTGRKYALIKKYALNMHVRLLTRLYGTIETESMLTYLYLHKLLNFVPILCMHTGLSMLFNVHYHKAWKG